MRLVKSICEEQYSRILADQPQGIGTTRTNLQRLLRSIDLVGWSRNEESGRLDRRALTKFATGSANIFSRRMRIEAEAAAVSILIDCSGSMHSTLGEHSRIDVAQQVAIHISKILQQSRTAFAVTGFRTAAGGTEYLKDGNYSQRPEFLPFKTWKQSLHQAAAGLGAINRTANAGTPDYSAIYNALEDLSQRPEARKILLLLTDANGYVRSHMQQLQKIADKIGVTIVAIGIQSYDVLECFVNAVNVEDLSGLAGASVNQLLKAVRK